MMYRGLRIPVIRIRDNGIKEKTIHILGTDSHDSLYVDDNGHLQYYNLQNGDGTLGDGYSFIGEEVNPEYEPYPIIGFITIDEAIKLDKELRKEAEKNLKELKKILGKNVRIID